MNHGPIDLKYSQELVQEFRKKQKMSPLQRLAYEYSGTDDIDEIVKYVLDESKKSGKMIPDVRMMKRYVENIRILKWPDKFQVEYLQEVRRLFEFFS
jgi:hypothetical protein